ncbi:MAG TPA: hypothetical protein VK845_07175, partial [Gemmatimonadales bacterium]|nr:hypothetical protein [Gemmatimonadales bacterium]
MRLPSDFAGRRPALRQLVIGPLLSLLAACASGDLKEGIGPDSSGLSALVVTPSSATVEANQAIPFAAYGRTQNGDSVGVSVEWSATGGAIDAAGTYTAGPAVGNFQVTAVVANGSITSSATVAVVSPGSGPVVTVVPTA